MPTIPSNNTGVLYVDYGVAEENHTIQCRFGSSASASDAQNIIHDLLTALSSLMYLITINGAKVRDKGTNVTYPVTWSHASTYGSGSGPHYYSAAYFDFVGRSIDGVRCRIAVFGAKGLADGSNNEDYRLTAAESVPIAAAISALDSGTDTPVSVSGLAVNWHLYANMGVNAYWRNHIRV